jgi:acyl dehydratase/predicted ester cyclase
MNATGKRLTKLNSYWDDLELGDWFVSPTHTVTQDDIAVYSDLSGDSHPLHTDPEVAAREIFGAITAQGLLTLSLATGLEYALIGPDISGILAFSGMDRVRFLKPVFLGDTIRLEGEVVALEPRKPDRALCVYRQYVKNQADETCVVLDKRMMLKRRAGAADRPAQRADGSARAVVDTMWQLIESGQLDRLGEVVADDVVAVLPGVTVRGVGELRGAIEAFCRAFPDLHHEIAGAVEARDELALELIVSGTHQGPLATPAGDVPPTGRRATWRAADLFSVRDGKVVEWHAYFDPAELAAQLEPEAAAAR